MNGDSSRVTSSGKPIVKLVDVTKIYEMGHSSGGGGLLSLLWPELESSRGAVSAHRGWVEILDRAIG